MPTTGCKTPEHGAFRRVLVEGKGLRGQFRGISLDLFLIEHMRPAGEALSDRQIVERKRIVTGGLMFCLFLHCRILVFRLPAQPVGQETGTWLLRATWRFFVNATKHPSPHP